MVRIGGWRESREVGGSVRDWSCTGKEYLYIYIYNSETPSRLQGSDDEPFSL